MIWQVVIDVIWMVVGCVYVCVGDCFVVVYQFFMFMEGVQYYCYCVQIECVGIQLYQVVQDVGDFVEYGVDVLCVFGCFDFYQGFDCVYVGVFVVYY